MVYSTAMSLNYISSGVFQLVTFVALHVLVDLVMDGALLDGWVCESATE